MSEAVPTILDTYEGLKYTPNPYEAKIVNTLEGVARITPNIEVIRDVARTTAAERGIILPEERFQELRFLQTSEALQASVLPVDEKKLDKVTRGWLYTTALANKFSPAKIGQFFHNVIPVAGSAIYLNTATSIEQVNGIYRRESRTSPTRDPRLYETALQQNLNFQARQAIERWIILSDPSLKRRAANIVDLFVYQPVATMLATKTLIGSLPLSLFLYNTQNATDLVKNMLVVGSIGLSVGLTKKVIQQRNAPRFSRDYEGANYQKDLLKIDF